MPSSRRRTDAANRSAPPLNHAILEAAAQHGFDRNGKDELIGYCRYLAENHPSSFATLLGKVLPMQVTGSTADPIQHEFTVKFIKPNGNPVS